jgi:hypothetical protein
MIKGIYKSMKNIGAKPFVEAEGKDGAKALERYKTDAENMTTKQLEYYVEDLKNGTGNLGPEYLEERMKIYGDELDKRKETAKKPEEKAGMPEKLKQAYIDHAKKIGVDSLESFIRNKDKAYVDYNDEIAQIFADELKARNLAK